MFRALMGTLVIVVAVPFAIGEDAKPFVGRSMVATEYGIVAASQPWPRVRAFKFSSAGATRSTPPSARTPPSA